MVGGAYTSQADHWAGRYRVLRQGRQVTATLAVHRSPVGHGAPLQPLFRLPEGYRPVLPVTWATTARPVTAQGRPRAEAPVVTVLLEARPDGTVHHVDAPTLDGTGYVGYHTVMVWTTDEAALLMAGTFATGEGSYRLMRLGDTVTATLAFPVADGSAAGLSAHLFTVPAGFRPAREATWTVPATVWVSASGSESSEAIGPSFDLRVHRDGKVVHVAPPRPAGYVATVTWRTADPGWMEVRGAYAPSRGDGTGRYSLRRDGVQVTATVTGEHGVPDTSVLFRVPAGFRPVQTVRQAGMLDAAGCPVLTLEVRPEGTVHLTGGSAETGAEPLAHETTLTWTAGADVCQRHPRVQAFLLRILWLDSCAEVTWTDLASMDSLDLGSGAFPAATLDAWLEGVSPQQVHDLADPGLRLPMDFLAHVPGLESLTLEVPADRTRLSADLLVHVPGLRSLTLKSEGLRELPPDLLAHVPGLEALTLEVEGLRELPSGLLVHVPRLESLTLEVPASQTRLPVDLLAHVPELRFLTLKGAELRELPPRLLAHVPRLWSLDLEAPELRELPSNLLVPARSLGGLTLDTPGLATLPSNLLAATPALYTFTLKAPGLRELPPDLLAHTPGLEYLTLETAELKELPPDLLPSSPRLWTITLKAAELTKLPTRFLIHTPGLIRLTLEASGLRELPPDFLAHTPELSELTLKVNGLTGLPPDFLFHAPRLSGLTLEASGLTELPPDFLAHVPGLQSLTLKSEGLTELPSDFLTHTPRLWNVTLETPNVTAMPTDSQAD